MPIFSENERFMLIGKLVHVMCAGLWCPADFADRRREFLFESEGAVLCGGCRPALFSAISPHYAPGLTLHPVGIRSGLKIIWFLLNAKHIFPLR